MEIFNAKFILGVAEAGKFPESNYPEVAFAGRSNVGKSSLINSFVKRKKLAKISSTPGKTSEINFFLVEQRWCLVDMPGFGYAAKGKELREKWAKVNYDYLENREHLRVVCILIDSRHDPQALDLSLIELLENRGKKYVIILTKCDKISKLAIEERHQQLKDLVENCKHCIEVLPYSSHSDLGRKELIGIIKRECVL